MTRCPFDRPSARFALLGALSFAGNLGLTAGLHRGLGLPADAAFAVALTAVFAANFVGMRTFVHPGQSGGAGRQLALFLACSAGFRGLEYGSFLALRSAFGIPYGAAIVATLGASFLVKHVSYKAVFRTRAVAAASIAP